MLPLMDSTTAANATQIVAVEAEATRIYMQLTHADTDEPKGSKSASLSRTKRSKNVRGAIRYGPPHMPSNICSPRDSGMTRCQPLDDSSRLRISPSLS